MKDNIEEISAVERAALRRIVEHARSAHHNDSRTGIAAALVMDDQLVAEAENLVKQHDDPTKHAEIVLLEKATTALGTRDLSGATLLSTLQPCEMCLAAIRFAGISRVIFAARQGSVAEKYFAFPHLQIDDYVGPQTEVTVIGGLLESEIVDLYANASE